MLQTHVSSSSFKQQLLLSSFQNAFSYQKGPNNTALEGLLGSLSLQNIHKIDDESLLFHNFSKKLLKLKFFTIYIVCLITVVLKWTAGTLHSSFLISKDDSAETKIAEFSHLMMSIHN